jgi:hypothetical protein
MTGAKIFCRQLPPCLRAQNAESASPLQGTGARITFGERLLRFGGMQPRRHASSPGCLRGLHRAANGAVSPIGFIGGGQSLKVNKEQGRSHSLASFSVSRLSSHCFDNGPVRA